MDAGQLIELQAGKAIGAQPGFVDSWNFMVDFVRQLDAGIGLTLTRDGPRCVFDSVTADGEGGGGTAPEVPKPWDIASINGDVVAFRDTYTRIGPLVRTPGGGSMSINLASAAWRENGASAPPPTELFVCLIVRFKEWGYEDDHLVPEWDAELRTGDASFSLAAGADIETAAANAGIDTEDILAGETSPGTYPGRFTITAVARPLYRFSRADADSRWHASLDLRGMPEICRPIRSLWSQVAEQEFATSLHYEELTPTPGTAGEFEHGWFGTATKRGLAFTGAAAASASVSVYIRKAVAADVDVPAAGQTDGGKLVARKRSFIYDIIPLTGYGVRPADPETKKYDLPSGGAASGRVVKTISWTGRNLNANYTDDTSETILKARPYEAPGGTT